MTLGLALLLAVELEVATRHEWGVSPEGPCVLTLAPCADQGLCWGEVVFVNRLVVRVADGYEVVTLTIEGLPVVVEVEQRPGIEPDLLRVTAPPGYAAVPFETTVEDGATATVRLVPALLG